MSTIGEIIREYRKNKNMTQTQLGQRLFVSKQAISKWERGVTLPDIEMLRKISTVLDIPVAVIMQKATSDPRLNAENGAKYPKGEGMSDKNSVEAWRDYKFGMFIHYGVYSVIGRINEWVMFHEPIDRDDYAEIARNEFRADAFCGEYYAKLAKKVGMRYMVLTTRHHDGFALFDSKCSHRDFTVMHTPCGRDLVADYVNACRGEGLGVGLYYSPMDWRFEGYFLPKMYRRSAQAMREQCFAQVRELMENYGKIDLLWFDGGEDGWLAFGSDINKLPPQHTDGVLIPEFWGEHEMHRMVRGLQPDIVINNRYGMRRLGDYDTPECRVGDFDPIHPWETCDTLIDGSWGWVPNKEIKSLRHIINIFVDVITGGGNLLLNVSPRPDGSLEPAHEARMLEVGEWVNKNAECIFDTHGGPFKNDNATGGFTYRDNSLFVFLKEESAASVDLPLLGASVIGVSARSGEYLDTRVENGRLKASFKGARAPIVSVIEIKLDKNIKDIYGPISEEKVFTEG